MREEGPVTNKLLKQARRHKGWTQGELAEKLGTNFETISRWERGTITPSLYYQKKLADVLEKTVEELGLSPEPNEEISQSDVPGVFLVASYPDSEYDDLFAQLKVELQVRDIPFTSTHLFRKIERVKKRQMFQEMIRVSLVVIVLISPYTRTSRHVREALQIAKNYKRSIYTMWITGECWPQCLPTGHEDLVCMYDIREGYDIKKIIADLEEGWLTPQTICTPAVSSSPDLPAPHTPSDDLNASDDRKRMLRRLGRTYRTLLDASLRGITWMELGLSEHPNAVRNATTLLHQLPSHTERTFPAGTSILSVYDQAEEELLILGAPGAGKSILLLKLACDLIARADVYETALLPVIVPLTSWATSQEKVADWLVEQLDRIYGVTCELGCQWVEQGQLLPLLDGLDEMEEAARPLCIAAIHAYHVEHITP